MYSARLRVGELLALRISEIDSDRMVIAVRGGKGDKDRYLPLAQNLLSLPILSKRFILYWIRK